MLKVTYTHTDTNKSTSDKVTEINLASDALLISTQHYKDTAKRIVTSQTYQSEVTEMGTVFCSHLLVKKLYNSIDDETRNHLETNYRSDH